MKYPLGMKQLLDCLADNALCWIHGKKQIFVSHCLGLNCGLTTFWLSDPV